MVYRLEELDWTMIVTIVDPEILRINGQRYDTPDVLEQKKRLDPLAEKYAGKIMGYDLKMRAEANYLEGVLVTRKAEREEQKKGAKQGTRKIETDTIRAGKLLLRQTATTLATAIRTRPMEEGQTLEQRADQTKLLNAQLEALRGQVKYEATTLRSKLESALTMTELAPLKARVIELQGERDVKAELTAMLGKLPTTSKSKETEKKRAIEETAALDVLDGLLYLNLKALVQAGRDHFIALGDHATAALFVLDVLNRRTTSAEEPKKQAEQPVEPVA